MVEHPFNRHNVYPQSWHGGSGRAPQIVELPRTSILTSSGLSPPTTASSCAISSITSSMRVFGVGRRERGEHTGRILYPVHTAQNLNGDCGKRNGMGAAILRAHTRAGSMSVCRWSGRVLTIPCRRLRSTVAPTARAAGRIDAEAIRGGRLPAAKGAIRHRLRTRSRGTSLTTAVPSNGFLSTSSLVMHHWKKCRPYARSRFD